MKAKIPSIRVKDIDHCRILAGIIEEMGLVEQINQELGNHPQENLQTINNLRWLSRVPATVMAAQQLMEQISSQAFQKSTISVYSWACVCSTDGGIKQRWLVVGSEARRESDLQRLEEKIQ